MTEAAGGALERAAREWVAPYRNAEHLYRTLAWVVVLRPDATPALRLAALTHDIERHFPGGPRLDALAADWDDPEYLRAHSERSARYVDAWLVERRADRELRESTAALIRAHETGGWPEADVLQAADSLSFLETSGRLVEEWVATGRCTPEKAEQKLRYMYTRIRDGAARPLAKSLLGEAQRRLAA